METAKRNIVLLDYINKITYIIPYDESECEDIEEHILNWSKQVKVNISLDNSNWMEVDELKLRIDPGTLDIPLLFQGKFKLYNRAC